MILSEIVFDGWMSYFWKMSHCNTNFDLKMNLGHSDLYFTVQWFLLLFALKNIWVIGKAWFKRAMLSSDSFYYPYIYMHPKDAEGMANSV